MTEEPERAAAGRASARDEKDKRERDLNFSDGALGMTQKELAEHIEQDVKVINRIVNGRTSVSAEMALKLAASFRTSPEFWLNAQKAVELHEARARLRRLPKPILRAG
jgi:addiction module HigA family antidote